MAFIPKRSKDSYIQLHKRITNPQVIKIVGILSDEQLVTPTEMCYKLINEAAMQEIKKREKLNSFLKEIKKP